MDQGGSGSVGHQDASHQQEAEGGGCHQSLSQQADKDNERQHQGAAAKQVKSFEIVFI